MFGSFPETVISIGLVCYALSGGLMLGWQIHKLALFPKFVRRFRRDDVRAPETVRVEPETVHVEPEHGLRVENGLLVSRFPLPTQEMLLEMLYQSTEKNMPCAILLELNFDHRFIQVMLDSANVVKPNQSTEPAEERQNIKSKGR